jgi:hypothetical protein
MNERFALIPGDPTRPVQTPLAPVTSSGGHLRAEVDTHRKIEHGAPQYSVMDPTTADTMSDADPCATCTTELIDGLAAEPAALSPEEVTARLGAAADAARLRAVNAGALAAKAEYKKRTLNGRELANVGKYKNPHQFRRRGLNILVAAYADGLTQIWAIKDGDSWFCVSTGPVVFDYVSLLKASAHKKGKNVLVVPDLEAAGAVHTAHTFVAGPFDREAGAFTSLDACFPMLPCGDMMPCLRAIGELQERARRGGSDMASLALLAALASASR